MIYTNRVGNENAYHIRPRSYARKRTAQNDRRLVLSSGQKIQVSSTQHAHRSRHGRRREISIVFFACVRSYYLFLSSPLLITVRVSTCVSIGRADTSSYVSTDFSIRRRRRIPYTVFHVRRGFVRVSSSLAQRTGSVHPLSIPSTRQPSYDTIFS